MSSPTFPGRLLIEWRKSKASGSGNDCVEIAVVQRTD